MSQDAASDARAAAPWRKRWVWPILKWSLFGLVILFVGRHAVELWTEDQVGHLDVNVAWPWLLPAGIAYAVGWLPSVWFWRSLMRSVGGRVSFLAAARAYYCGHLGKYVPGKATVLVIRAALVKDNGCRVSAAALTVTYETLAFMGVGLIVTCALSPVVLSESQWALLPAPLPQLRDVPLLTATAVISVVVVLMPVLSRLFTKVAVAVTPRDVAGNDPNIKIETRLLLAGVLAFFGAWLCHGLSLGFTLSALSSRPLNLTDWPVWTAAVSGATSIGFFVLFAPGGLGVREGLLIEVLRVHPAIGQQQAVAAAVLLRAVWLVTEIVAAGVLYYGIRPATHHDENRETQD